LEEVPCEQETTAVLHKARARPTPIRLYWVTGG
jgi:hypothetical protein